MTHYMTRVGCSCNNNSWPTEFIIRKLCTKD